MVARTRRKRFSRVALESALGEALRAIASLEARTERLEKSLAAARAIARNSDEVPAWIELARRAPLGTAVFERAVDPRAMLALVLRADALPVESSVLILADDAVGPIAAHAVLSSRPDLRPVVVMSTDAETSEERSSPPGIEVRHGTVTLRSFGDIAGYWYDSSDLGGITDVSLVFVAGPSHSYGPAARHAVAAGVGELTARATLVVARPSDPPVARAVKLWRTTAQQSMTITAVSPWEYELSATRLS
jgi:hypothetical protein